VSCEMSDDYQCSFSDMSDDDLVSAMQLLLNECVSADLWNDGANDELLVAASQAYNVCDGDEGGSRSTAAAGTFRPTRFGESSSEQDLNNIQQGRFPQNTVNNATWAVTLFGDWHGERNRRCVEQNDVNLVYINKPFCTG